MFIGYPLGDPTGNTAQAYLTVCERFKPATVAVIAPRIWLPEDACEMQSVDRYYRLKLPLESIQAEVAYMVRRAQKDLVITRATFGRKHRRMVREFLKTRQFKSEQIYLFRHLHHYLKRSSSATLLDARKGNDLVAFSIIDLGSADYAFYLFNFRSTELNVPGASDLLFQEMVNIAQSSGKSAINLGLGINSGIRRFKAKWGGVPFLSCETAVINRAPSDFDGLAKKL
jgi:hypothetical protein